MGERFGSSIACETRSRLLEVEFVWVGDILKKQAEDGLVVGTREVTVIPKGLKQTMIRLAHDHKAHVDMRLGRVS